MEIMEMMKTARTPYELNCKPGDKVLIIADTRTEPLVWQAFGAAAKELGLIYTIAIMENLPYHHAEPTPQIADAMMHADVVHLVTHKGLVHCNACHEAMKNKVKIIASEQITVDMLREGGATADYHEMNKVGRRIFEILCAGETYELYSKYGLDFHSSIKGRSSWLVAGIVFEQPAMDLLASGFPDGEVGMSPIEDTEEGVVVWDLSAHQLGLLDKPIKMKVEKGWVKSIEGGKSADDLKRYLDEHGDEGAWRIGEASLGINPKCRVTGLMREDKKIAGCSHIALGMNTDTGGIVASKIHLDGVVKKVTCVVDGNKIIEDGKILV